eukprot:SAG11_NODE_1426_length_4943_cov_7.372419_4_plen_79_part_00
MQGPDYADGLRHYDYPMGDDPDDSRIAAIRQRVTHTVHTTLTHDGDGSWYAFQGDGGNMMLMHPPPTHSCGTMWPGAG